MQAPAGMNDTLARDLLILLQHRNPAQALLVSHTAWPELAAWASKSGHLRHLQGATRYRKQDRLARYDLALLVDQLEYMRRPDAIEFMAQLRNRHAPVVAVAADLARLRATDEAWSPSDFIGLGLEPRTDTAEPGPALFLYDLAEYNAAREWNNPRYWAHPENFRKFRW